MPEIDKEEHRQVHGSRVNRMLGLVNDIARFLNVEAHATKAFTWLTETIKNSMFSLWKTVSDELRLVCKRVGNALGFGAGEEIPADSILNVETYTDELVLPVY
jgi:hypothetical protein